MRLHAHAMPDDSSLQAVMYGPLVLVGRMGTQGITAENRRAEPTKPRTVPEFKDPAPPPAPQIRTVIRRRDELGRAGSRARRSSSRRRGSRSAMTLVPLYRLFDERYVVYWTVESRIDESGHAGTGKREGHGRPRDELSRREWLKVVGAAGAASVVSGAAEWPTPCRGRRLTWRYHRRKSAEVLPLDVHERRVRAAARRRVHEVQLRLPGAVGRVRRTTGSASSCSPTRTRTGSTRHA